MKKKKWILSIGISFLLVLTIIPVINSQSKCLDLEKSGEDRSISESPLGGSDTMVMNIYHFKKDKSIEKTQKKLTLIEGETLMNQLTQNDESDLLLSKIFNEKLDVLKSYDLVSNNIALEDIVDVDLDGEGDDDIVEGENFSAQLAPILFRCGSFQRWRCRPRLERTSWLCEKQTQAAMLR